MHDLISTTDEIHYESFRMNRLQNRGGYVDDAVVNKYVCCRSVRSAYVSYNGRARHNFEALIKDEELRFRNRLAEKVKVEEQRFQQWEQRVSGWSGVEYDRIELILVVGGGERTPDQESGSRTCSTEAVDCRSGSSGDDVGRSTEVSPM